MNKEEFKLEVNKLGITLTDDILNKLDIYANFLVEYNTHTNLTTITNLEDIYLKHFYDSLTIINNELFNFDETETLVDVGTGAGFPGMVLKIVFPNIKVILIDSNNKKTNFLKELSKKLELCDIEIINARSEEYALKNLDKYDIVTSRAVANLNILSELCLPMVKVGGYFIALKGNIDEELSVSENKIRKLNGSVVEIKDFNLIKEQSKRNILYIKKINKNPSCYPRSYSKIKKEHEKINHK